MYENAQQSVEFIRQKVGDDTPDVAVVLGSGLGAFADQLEDAVTIPYGDIPYFPISTAPSHKGQMVVGRLNGKRVLCMQGRFHYFEGYTMQQVTYYVRVLKLLGIPAMLLTNAAGTVDENFAPGDFMLVTDHINYMGANPLTGQNDERFGLRFVDMTYAYDKNLRDLIKRAAASAGIDLKEGVYVAFAGPTFETPAEIRMVRGWGGTAVGMSTVPEVIVANHCAMPVAAVSVVTNMAAGMLDQRLSSDEVEEMGKLMKDKVVKLLGETIKLLP